MSVSDRVRRAMSTLSPGEKQLARVLLADYPSAGLGTSADLGRTADVSAATVVRFARSLGFGGFSELQADLVSELSERGASPVTQYGGSRERRPVTDHWFDDAVAVTVGEAERSLEAIPKGDLDASVALLADRKRRVRVLGGRYSGFVARYFAFHLQQVRPDVLVLGDDVIGGVAAAIDAQRRDVAVVFDLRRYQASTIAAARAMAGAGTTIVCITDEWLSPVADVSAVTLTTSVASVGPFDSAAGAFVLSELLVDGVLQSLGDEALQRMEQWERAGGEDVLA
ncbi:MAG: MurR/RpiR family transcriptional regulator [Knoellia sp.]